LQTRRDESLNESSRRVFAGVHRAGGEGVDFEHLNDCLGAINVKIDRYRGSTT
jgi:hypothetical protein